MGKRRSDTNMDQDNYQDHLDGTDGGGGGGGDDPTPTHRAFARADATQLARRRIVRVPRSTRTNDPSAGGGRHTSRIRSPPSAAASTATNPFAKVQLQVAASTTQAPPLSSFGKTGGATSLPNPTPMGSWIQPTQPTASPRRAALQAARRAVHRTMQDVLWPAMAQNFEASWRNDLEACRDRLGRLDEELLKLEDDKNKPVTAVTNNTVPSSSSPPAANPPTFSFGSFAPPPAQAPVVTLASPKALTAATSTSTTVGASVDTANNNNTDSSSDQIAEARDEGFDAVADYDKVAVYHFANAKWAKLGGGTLKIQKHVASGAHRMVLREGLRVALNVKVGASSGSGSDSNEKEPYVRSEIQSKRGLKGQVAFSGVNGVDGHLRQFVVRSSVETSHALHEQLKALSLLLL